MDPSLIPWLLRCLLKLLFQLRLWCWCCSCLWCCQDVFLWPGQACLFCWEMSLSTGSRSGHCHWETTKTIKIVLYKSGKIILHSTHENNSTFFIFCWQDLQLKTEWGYSRNISNTVQPEKSSPRHSGKLGGYIYVYIYIYHILYIYNGVRAPHVILHDEAVNSN